MAITKYDELLKQLKEHIEFFETGFSKPKELAPWLNSSGAAHTKSIEQFSQAFSSELNTIADPLLHGTPEEIMQKFFSAINAAKQKNHADAIEGFFKEYPTIKDFLINHYDRINKAAADWIKYKNKLAKNTVVAVALGKEIDEKMKKQAETTAKQLTDEYLKILISLREYTKQGGIDSLDLFKKTVLSSALNITKAGGNRTVEDRINTLKKFFQTTKEYDDKHFKDAAEKFITQERFANTDNEIEQAKVSNAVSRLFNSDMEFVHMHIQEFKMHFMEERKKKLAPITNPALRNLIDKHAEIRLDDPMTFVKLNELADDLTQQRITSKIFKVIFNELTNVDLKREELVKLAGTAAANNDKPDDDTPDKIDLKDTKNYFAKLHRDIPSTRYQILKALNLPYNTQLPFKKALAAEPIQAFKLSSETKAINEHLKNLLDAKINGYSASFAEGPRKKDNYTPQVNSAITEALTFARKQLLILQAQHDYLKRTLDKAARRSNPDDIRKIDRLEAEVLALEQHFNEFRKVFPNYLLEQFKQPGDKVGKLFDKVEGNVKDLRSRFKVATPKPAVAPAAEHPIKKQSEEPGVPAAPRTKMPRPHQ